MGRQAFTIFNKIGQLVKEGYVETSIDVSELPDGIYSIIINGQNQRFVINK